MVEYRDDGEPIPDGRITIEISEALARVWDPISEGPPLYKNPQQTYVYEMANVRGFREEPMYMVVQYRHEDPDTPSFIKIPWAQILCVEVRGNSDEYVKAAREFNDREGSTEYRDTRFGGRCIGCASSSRVRF